MPTPVGPAPASNLPTASGREQYEGQFNSLRLIAAVVACVAVILVALYLR